MIAITLLIFVILAPLLILTAFFSLELFVGFVPAKLNGTNKPPKVSAAIVIPAHNEEEVIARTVGATLAHSAGDYQLLVVADNCSDRTADLARAAGAQVTVRDELEHRGKGFALAAARDRLRADPPAIVIVLDADCRIDRKSMDALASAAASSGRACQAVNLLSPDLAASPLVQISTFAFMIKNLIRQRGLQRLANRAHLTGTGMALPWCIFSQANLGGANIVEDLALGLELAETAAGPMLVSGAIVWSPPASASGTLVQRKRWEGGYLATALKVAPATLVRSLGRADVRGICAALDLSIPPLALLVLLNAAGLCLAFSAALVGASLWPALVQLTLGLVAAFAIACAWVAEGRNFASGTALLRLPIYVLWKLPMYIGLVRRGAPKEWLRSGR